MCNPSVVALVFRRGVGFAGHSTSRFGLRIGHIPPEFVCVVEYGVDWRQSCVLSLLQRVGCYMVYNIAGQVTKS